MNRRLAKLAERRAALAARAEHQRLDVAQSFEPWRGVLGIADHGLFALHYIAKHKALVAGVLAAAVALRPKGGLGLLRQGWRIWRTALMLKRTLGG